MRKVKEERRLKASEILANEIKALNERDNLSSREINRLKRKAKLEAKANSAARGQVYTTPTQLNFFRV